MNFLLEMFKLNTQTLEPAIKFSIIATPLAAITSFLFGDWTQMHTILISMMALDFITGLMKGFYNKKLDSKVGYKGLMRKAGIILAVIVANFADIIMGSDIPVISTGVILFYIAIEAISLLENLEAVGVPLPDKLKSYFNQMRETNNEKDFQKVEEEIMIEEGEITDENKIN